MSIVMAVLLILFSAFAAIMRNTYFWTVITAGVKLRVALSGLIFKKVCPLSQIVPWLGFFVTSRKESESVLDPAFSTCCLSHLINQINPIIIDFQLKLSDFYQLVHNQQIGIIVLLLLYE